LSQNQYTERTSCGTGFYCLLLPRKKALAQNCESSDSKPYSCTAATGLSYSTKVGGGGGIRGGKERVINTSEFWPQKVGVFIPSKSIEAFGQLLQ